MKELDSSLEISKLGQADLSGLKLRERHEPGTGFNAAEEWILKRLAREIALRLFRQEELEKAERILGMWSGREYAGP